MAQIHLIRHGHHALLGRILCGRMPGVALSEEGCREVNAAAELLVGLGPDLIQSSPRHRALQSAAIIAALCGKPIEIVHAVDEIDMGHWTGRSFHELNVSPAWQRWNTLRGSAAPPGGESMSALQRRVVAHIGQFADENQSVVIVSHADPIRAALMYYLGVPLDLFHSLDVDTASVSTITLDGSHATVSRLNHKVAA